MSGGKCVQPPLCLFRVNGHSVTIGTQWSLALCRNGHLVGRLSVTVARHSVPMALGPGCVGMKLQLYIYQPPPTKFTLKFLYPSYCILFDRYYLNCIAYNEQNLWTKRNNYNLFVSLNFPCICKVHILLNVLLNKCSSGLSSVGIASNSVQQYNRKNVWTELWKVQFKMRILKQALASLLSS